MLCSRALPVETAPKIIEIPRKSWCGNIAPYRFSLPQPSRQDLLRPVSLFQMPILPMPIHMPGGRDALIAARKSDNPRFHHPPGIGCCFQHLCTPMPLSARAPRNVLAFFAESCMATDPQFPAFRLRGIPKTIRLPNVLYRVASNARHCATPPSVFVLRLAF
jgi:hypothetical protein